MGERLFNWAMDHVMPWLGLGCIALCVLFLIVLPVGCVMDAQSPTFSLKKSDWVCAQSHQENTTTYVKSGSVMVPVTSQATVCDAYTRTAGGVQ